MLTTYRIPIICCLITFFACAHQEVSTQDITRKQQALVLLQQADMALSKGDDVVALELASKSRQVPIDLQDVMLLRKIDETLEQAAVQVFKQSQTAFQQQRYLEALKLSQALHLKVPQSRNYEDWNNKVQEQALVYTQEQALQAEKANLKEAATFYWLLSKRLGAEVSLGKLQYLMEPQTCAQKIQVTVQQTKECGMCNDFAKQLTTDLQPFVCASAFSPLELRVFLEEVKTRDDQHVVHMAKPRIGYTVETTEVYEVETPYTALEEVTEYEIKHEQQERRDCTPKPGEERGCKTWLEDVEIKVPIVIEKPVQKMKRVLKTKPLNKTFSPSQVVYVDVQEVERDVLLKGHFQLSGAVASKDTLHVQLNAFDTAHAKIDDLEVDADPMTASTTSELMLMAQKQVGAQVQAILQQALRQKLIAEKTSPVKANRLLALFYADKRFVTGLDGILQESLGLNTVEIAELLQNAKAEITALKAPTVESVVPKITLQKPTTNTPLIEFKDLEEASLKAAKEQDVKKTEE